MISPAGAHSFGAHPLGSPADAHPAGRPCRAHPLALAVRTLASRALPGPHRTVRHRTHRLTAAVPFHRPRAGTPRVTRGRRRDRLSPRSSTGRDRTSCSSSSGSGTIGSPYSSPSQRPKSICLQRGEQNGIAVLSNGSNARLHIGHLQVLEARMVSQFADF